MGYEIYRKCQELHFTTHGKKFRGHEKFRTHQRLILQDMKFLYFFLSHDTRKYSQCPTSYPQMMSHDNYDKM